MLVKGGFGLQSAQKDILQVQLVCPSSRTPCSTFPSRSEVLNSVLSALGTAKRWAQLCQLLDTASRCGPLGRLAPVWFLSVRPVCAARGFLQVYFEGSGVGFPFLSLPTAGPP